jgi:hypothetical protein
MNPVLTLGSAIAKGQFERIWIYFMVYIDREKRSSDINF